MVGGTRSADMADAELTETADRLRDIDEQINAILASVRAHAYDQDRRAILDLLSERIWVEHDGTDRRAVCRRS